MFGISRDSEMIRKNKNQGDKEQKQWHSQGLVLAAMGEGAEAGGRAVGGAWAVRVVATQRQRTVGCPCTTPSEGSRTDKHKEEKAM